MTYAIMFDIDADCLVNHYGGVYNDAYYDISKVLNEHGFECQQGTVYFGIDGKTAVDCVLAIQDLASQFDWFALCVKNVGMLRIEEVDDLKPAIDKVVSLKRKPL